ncbi:MAG: DUF3501 family protein [Myxococcota bacterium]
MRPLAAPEIADLRAYAELRPDYRRAVIEHKKLRRVAIGDRVTLVFEDRETLRFQVQEMLFVERIGDPARVQQELDVYNELMPGERELSATLFIEITDLPEIRPELLRLVGLDEHVWLVLGEDDDATRIHARFDPKQMEEDRLSAVQYVRFALDEEQARRFEDDRVPVSLEIDHPNYAARVEMSPQVRASLAAGLRSEPAPLLVAGAVAPTPDRVLFETGRVRATLLGAAPVRAHVVVETIGEDLGEALWDEMIAAVREAAKRVAAEHGRARIRADTEGERIPLRWHVHSIDE